MRQTAFELRVGVQVRQRVDKAGLLSQQQRQCEQKRKCAMRCHDGPEKIGRECSAISGMRECR